MKKDAPYRGPGRHPYRRPGRQPYRGPEPPGDDDADTAREPVTRVIFGLSATAKRFANSAKAKRFATSAKAKRFATYRRPKPYRGPGRQLYRGPEPPGDDDADTAREPVQDMSSGLGENLNKSTHYRGPEPPGDEKI